MLHGLPEPEDALLADRPGQQRAVEAEAILLKGTARAPEGKRHISDLAAVDHQDVILAAALKEDGVGFAVMNRMFKSAGYNIIEV